MKDLTGISFHVNTATSPGELKISLNKKKYEKVFI